MKRSIEKEKESGEEILFHCKIGLIIGLISGVFDICITSVWNLNPGNVALYCVAALIAIYGAVIWYKEKKLWLDQFIFSALGSLFTFWMPSMFFSF